MQIKNHALHLLASQLLQERMEKRNDIMKSQWYKKVGLFFVAVYLLSGMLWVPVLLSGKGMTTLNNKITVAIITFIPSLLGVLYVYLTKNRLSRQDFWRRVLRWPHRQSGFAIAAICLPAILALCAFFLSSAVDGRAIQFSYARQMLRTPILLFQFLAVELLFGAVSEEFGWRGFALDELQSRWSALSSALILGIVWGLWHLPAFFVPGLAQYEMRSPVAMVLFIVNVILGSLLQTWGYNKTGRSILVGGILMHFSANAAIVLTNGIFSSYSTPPSYSYVQVGLNFLVAILIVVIWKPQSLAQRPSFSSISDEQSILVK